MSENAFDSQPEEDPAAEFLAREQADLAGIDDDIATMNMNSDSEPHLNGNASQGYDSGSNGPSHMIPREEPEKIKKWREEQKAMIEQKDANEEVKKREMKEQAAKEVEEWYQRYQEQIAKAKQTNRNAEKEYVCEKAVAGAEWEGIAKLCDFNAKTSSTRHTKDVSRLKGILLQLKQQPPQQPQANRA